MTRLVLCEQVGPVVVLTLNRPERHNSLVPALLEELLAAIESAQALADVRAVVLQASGRSFSTGGDVQGFYEHRDDLPAYGHRIVGLLNRAILALVDMRLPAVAAVHGIVTGGSMGLVLGCDVVLVGPKAGFTPYYGVVGFSPDGGWTAMLPAIIGAKRAAEVLMCNRTITAEQAVAWGLASRIIPGESIRDEALSVAQDIAAKKPGSIGHTKRLLRPAYGDPSPGSGQGLEARLEDERSRFAQQITSAEARQGIVTFLEGSRK